MPPARKLADHRRLMREILRIADRLVPSVHHRPDRARRCRLALLYLLPQLLGLFAPPLDPRLDLYAVNRPMAFTFLDADGNDVGHRGAVVGERLKLEEMPAYLPAAFIAMEDRRFYSHNGIDPRGLIARAAARSARRSWVAGGSTITQQTAKIVYTQQERTMSRKLTELMDAAGLEKVAQPRSRFSSFISTASIWAAAPMAWMARRASISASRRADVTLAQAAMLATLTRAPSVFSPRRDLLRGAAARQPGAGRHGGDRRHHARRRPPTPAPIPPSIIDRASMDARNYFLDTAADEAKQLATVNGAGADGRSDRPHHPGAETAGSRAPGRRCAPSPNTASATRIQRSRGGDDEARWRGGGPDRRRRLSALGVQPRHPGAPPARLGLQALRLSGGAGSRHLALGHARRRAGGHQRLQAGQFRRQCHMAP